MSFKRLFIITGDASGDLHGSFVIRTMQTAMPDVEIEAIGGEKIASTGVTLFHRQEKLGVLGASVVGAMPSHYFLGKKLLRYLRSWRPDAILLIDYGMFNLWIAKHLKRLGIKVFYYIPPQVWASRRGRIRSIQRFVDHVFCIFPFEKTLYESHGIPVTFVGHPLVEQLSAPPDRVSFCEQHQLDPTLPIIGIFPGSRKLEIQSLLGPMVKALPLIQEKSGLKCQFLLARSAAVSDACFDQAFAPVKSVAEGVAFKILRHQNQEILALSQAALVASGTVTLESALYRIPVVIAYKLSRLAYMFFKRFCYVKHIGLPNLLVSERFLPELMMTQVNPDALSNAIMPYLTASVERRHAETCFTRIQQMLGNTSASINVVKGIAALMAYPLSARHSEDMAEQVLSF